DGHRIPAGPRAVPGPPLLTFPRGAVPHEDGSICAAAVQVVALRHPDTDPYDRSGYERDSGPAGPANEDAVGELAHQVARHGHGPYLHIGGGLPARSAAYDHERPRAAAAACAVMHAETV